MKCIREKDGVKFVINQELFVKDSQFSRLPVIIPEGKHRCGKNARALTNTDGFYTETVDNGDIIIFTLNGFYPEEKPVEVTILPAKN